MKWLQKYSHVFAQKVQYWLEKYSNVLTTREVWGFGQKKQEYISYKKHSNVCDPAISNSLCCQIAASNVWGQNWLQAVIKTSTLATSHTSFGSELSAGYQPNLIKPLAGFYKINLLLLEWEVFVGNFT